MSMPLKTLLFLLGVFWSFSLLFLLISLKENSSFTSLFVGILIISMVVGFYLLTKGGDLLSDHCSNLAKAIGIASILVKYLTIIEDELIESKATESNNHIFRLDCN